jgi:hypothetical protein
MYNETVTQSSRTRIIPADLVASKPDEAFLWRQEMGSCRYDYVTQVRKWEESEKIHDMMMSTGAPSSSTAFDGEKEE